MIIVKITGGLGNQLFQYAFSRQLSQNTNAAIKFDISHYSTDALRTFELNKLNIVGNIATREEVTRIKLENSFPSLLKRKFNTLTRPYYKRNIIEERYFSFDKNLLCINSNSYVSGYFQSEKYFSLSQEVLYNEITPKQNILSEQFPLLKREILSTNSVSLHVRRGDYISNKTSFNAHGICSFDYYQKAVELIAKQNDNFIIYVFSDDRKWCKDYLRMDYPVHFIDKTNQFEDLFLMKSCKHNIIANSSFSWWGAWLNGNKEKIVVAPQKWFDKRDSDTKDLIPSNWFKI